MASWFTSLPSRRHPCFCLCCCCCFWFCFWFCFCFCFCSATAVQEPSIVDDAVTTERGRARHLFRLRAHPRRGRPYAGGLEAVPAAAPRAVGGPSCARAVGGLPTTASCTRRAAGSLTAANVTSQTSLCAHNRRSVQAYWLMTGSFDQQRFTLFCVLFVVGDHRHLYVLLGCSVLDSRFVTGCTKLAGGSLAVMPAQGKTQGSHQGGGFCSGWQHCSHSDSHSGRG